MIILIITAIITLFFLILLLAICFFDLGYISKELVLYSIKKQKKADKQRADKQLELVKKIIADKLKL